MSTTVSQPSPSPHLRLTADQILSNYRQGLYTAQGYLLHLIRALRKDGWWLQIPSVAAFCRQWEIPRRTFYWAKAQLIARGVLKERLDKVDLMVIEDGPTALEKPPTAAVEPAAPTDGPTAPERPPTAAVEPAAPTPPPPPPEEEPTANEDSRALLDWVIRYKIPKLPNPPASAESAARGWIDKHGSALRREYDQWRSRPHPSPAAPPPPAPEPSETPTQAAKRLGVNIDHPQLQQLRRRPGALVRAIAALAKESPRPPDPTQWVLDRILR